MRIAGKRLGAAAIALCAVSFAEAAEQVEPTEPEASHKVSGTIEVGALAYTLSAGLGDWRGEFVRTVVNDGDTVWNADLLDIRQYGERTQVGSLAATYKFHPDWFASGTVAASTGGNIQARRKLDFALSRLWLAERNLVTTVGVGGSDSRDGHRDYSLLLSGVYYFTIPVVVDGGVRINQSNPGYVMSYGKYISVTYGREKENVFNVRYGFGSEAYQSVGSAALLTDFNSDVLTLTWRTWIRADLALQTRAELYRNPYYDRRGLELSIVKGF